MVRSKFVCTSNDAGSITLHAVVSGSPENEQFFHYTPSGVVTLNTISEAAVGQFVQGVEYYVDFSAAPSFPVPHTLTLDDGTEKEAALAGAAGAPKDAADEDDDEDEDSKPSTSDDDDDDESDEAKMPPTGQEPRGELVPA